MALDADGDLLRHGCKAKPFLIKPNLFEFQRLTDIVSTAPPDLLEAARRIIESGVEVVLVSMGAQGLLGARGNEAYLALPPQVEVISCVGAGDSALAGFVCAFTDGMDFRSSLIMAAAAGTASVITPGTELCKKQDVERIQKKITIKKM